jgi:uncharacterized protein YndB with AHSA1/START domain
MTKTAAAPTTRATVTTPTDRTIHIERIFNAPRERVWKAITDRKLVIEKFEPVKGGHWRFVEHAGGETHGFEGRYREVTPIERVVQTFEWDGMPGHVVLESIELQDLGDGRTKIVNTSLFFTTEERDGMLNSGMEGGLNESYAALDRLLATMG